MDESQENMGTDLEGVVSTFQAWLHLPDPAPLLALFATVAANRMSGDPVWLLLVGPPGSGKSEQIESLRGLPDVHPTATLTEAALLSGTPTKERAKDARGGLLRVIGARGMILCKDFGSVLSMNRDARASVLAALREVFDGAWTRHLGTDGGRTLEWSGHVGFVGGCPPTIDRHHGVMASLGERFLFLRLEEHAGKDRARRALERAGRESTMRSALTASVAKWFSELKLPTDPFELSDEHRDDLVRLASLVTRCRSTVERNGYSRDIEFVPGAESPTRLAVTLKRLHDGLTAIGAGAVAWRVVRRVALDSMPVLRREALRAVHRLGQPETAVVATVLGYPATTTRRTLEELAAYSVLERLPDGAGKDYQWRVSETVAEDLASIPEMSDPPRGVSESQTLPETSAGSSSSAEPTPPSSPSLRSTTFRERPVPARPGVAVSNMGSRERGLA